MLTGIVCIQKRNECFVLWRMFETFGVLFELVIVYFEICGLTLLVALSGSVRRQLQQSNLSRRLVVALFYAVGRDSHLLISNISSG